MGRCFAGVRRSTVIERWGSAERVGRIEKEPAPRWGWAKCTTAPSGDNQTGRLDDPRLPEAAAERRATHALGVEANIIFGRLDDSSQSAGQEPQLDLVEIRFVDRLLHAIGRAERRPRQSAASAEVRGVRDPQHMYTDATVLR